MERRRAAQSREQLAPLLVLLLFARATLAQPAGPEVALATSEPEIRAALLEQRKAILNWDDFQRNQGWRGWDNVSSICNWSGIQCAAGPGGDVTKGFNLSIACDASVTPPVGEACASPAAEGSLAYELAKLAPLQALTVLGMNIDGTLPQAWGDTNSFPSLRLLRLGNNVRSGSFIGPLPDGWGNPRAFPSLRVLDLSGALMPFSLAGQGQPAAPGSSPTTGVDPGTPPGGVRGLPDPWWRLGFLQLEVLSLSRCSVGGFLPDTWLNPKLRSLDLSSNGFKGVLPSGWGNGTLEALQSLKLDLNPNLTGSIPVEWANWSSLTQLDLGGTSICGEVPANASFETVCGDSTNSCLLPTCPEPLESSDGSSAPVGAIVGGVLGGVAALALLAFLALRPGGGWLRRPAVAAAPSAGKGSLGPGLEDSQPSASVDVESGASRALSGGSAGTARLASQGSLLLTDPVLLYVTTNLASMRERQQRMLEASPSGRLRLAAAADAVAGAGAGADASTGVRTPSAATPSLASASYQSSAGTAQQLPTQAQSGLGEVLTASQRLSSTVKRWEVQWEELRPDKLLGKGSFARVYLAQFRETPVACKLLMTMDECCDSSFILPEKVLNDLEEEAAVLVRMRHPNIVSFMGLCTLPPCIVTEYCSKGSLFDVLRRAERSPRLAAQLTWPLRLQMALDAARGLLYLHGCDPMVIHRDVKSPNFLVDEHWRVKVADFNLSKVLGPVALGSVAKSSIATNPIWQAPEVMAGARPTAAADVWAFGLVMYELLTWRLPWGAGDGVLPFQIMYQVIEGKNPQVPPLNELPGVDKDIMEPTLEEYCAVMRECWDRDPLQRPTLHEIVPRLRGLCDKASRLARRASLHGSPAPSATLPSPRQDVSSHAPLSSGGGLDAPPTPTPAAAAADPPVQPTPAPRPAPRQVFVPPSPFEL